MTEIEVITRLKAELNSINGLAFHIVDRNFDNRTSYIATIAVIVKDNVLTQDIIKSLITSLVDDGIDKIKVVGTQKRLDDLDFEVLTIEAEINLV